MHLQKINAMSLRKKVMVSKMTLLNLKESKSKVHMSRNRYKRGLRT